MARCHAQHQRAEARQANLAWMARIRVKSDVIHRLVDGAGAFHQVGERDGPQGVGLRAGQSRQAASSTEPIRDRPDRSAVMAVTSSSGPSIT